MKPEDRDEILKVLVGAIRAGSRAAIGYIRGQAGAYSKSIGDDTLCICGHPYHRHFDSYDDMKPVGCKYCPDGHKFMPKESFTEHDRTRAEKAYDLVMNQYSLESLGEAIRCLQATDDPRLVPMHDFLQQLYRTKTKEAV